MADYQLTNSETVIRSVDSASIPADPANRDRAEYEAWLVDGGVPDPADEIPPPSAPGPTAEQEILFDHENRVRALEGQPPLTMDEFAAKAAPK